MPQGWVELTGDGGDLDTQDLVQRLFRVKEEFV